MTEIDDTRLNKFSYTNKILKILVVSPRCLAICFVSTIKYYTLYVTTFILRNPIKTKSEIILISNLVSLAQQTSSSQKLCLCYVGTLLMDFQFFGTYIQFWLISMWAFCLSECKNLPSQDFKLWKDPTYLTVIT